MALDPNLQVSIDSLQSAHTSVIEKVRGYTGGSIAKAANSLLLSHETTRKTINDSEATLVNQILSLDDSPVPSFLAGFIRRSFMKGDSRIEHGYPVNELLGFKRSTVKWAFGPSGNITQVPVDTLAYAYDPMTGYPIGALIEGTTTNLRPYSHEFGRWTVANGTSFATSSESSIFDGIGPWKFNEGTQAGVQHYFVSGATLTPGFYTDSIIVKPGERSKIEIRVTGYGPSSQAGFDLTTGQLFNTPSPAQSSAKMTRLPNGYWLCEVTFYVETEATGNVLYMLSKDGGTNEAYTGEGDKGVYVLHAQLEANSCSTSRILCTGTPTTRAADDPTWELDSSHNREGFSFYLEGVQGALQGTALFYSDTGSLNTHLRVGFPDNNSAVVWFNQSNAGARSILMSDFPSYVPGTPFKLALSVSSSKIAVALNGELTRLDISNRGIPAVNRARLGAIASTNNSINGRIVEFREFPVVLSEEQIVEMTA